MKNRAELARLLGCSRASVTRVPGGDRVYGTQQERGPACWADDDSAEVLGALEHNQRPGLVRKQVHGHTAVYSSGPCLPAWLLRDLARSGGVHIYLDEDAIVYANKSLLSVTAIRAGAHLIHLPHPATVEDLYPNTAIATATTEFTYPSPKAKRRCSASSRGVLCGQVAESPQVTSTFRGP